MNISITPLTPALGAQIEGIDLRDLDDETFAVLRSAVVNHQVVFLRDQDLTEEQQLRLASRFGAPDVYPISAALGSQSAMTYIEDNADNPPGADNWHTDLTWRTTPPHFALLNARVIPPSGGDTMWASLHALYDALSPMMQDLCRDLRVIHSPGSEFFRQANRLAPNHVEQLRNDYPPIEHPLICRHPESGRELVFISGDVFMDGIANMYPDESRLLLGYLRQLLDRHDLQVRWRWRTHDVAIWDERSTNHRALGDHYPEHRLMRRCVIAGQMPPMPSPA